MNKEAKNFFRNTTIVAISVFFVAILVRATTTIGDNITTEGTLSVTELSTLGRTTSTSATTTDYLWVGSNFTLPAGIDYVADLMVFDDAYSNSQATTSASLWVGSGGTATWLNLAGGDLFVQDDAQIGDALTVGGTASSTALIVGGTATTTKLIVGERQATNATTTVVFGDLASESAPCIKLRTTAGQWVYAYPTSSADMLIQGLVWTNTSCE
ncbi:MAG: hypothetical protein A3B31_01975 [Candidatus Komeilibacteria bacterium RIFCSPLOWO2_01_FULL_53_11]|uniref:Uncharacterized protein n=1 Tax=Candidatus Komeilibacteria bacterium RIFCSPLOWO2_01_FULL_53_11 TaxID=1798552 RepID=A0A1G2BSX9_9BACT|nr:MAG: hypothetical protein A3B31_01975 [Candidatus Komeilibacteria bacterium RIFCSPLOWO2_01_FULL_53_11]